jgi:hypothetical protein
MTQSYATHRRMDPGYHYVAFALWIAALVMAVRHVFQHRPGTVFELTLLAFLFLIMLKVRTYALRVQDRVIRLEETLRMQALLPEALKGELHRLTPGQFVALRFASDGELAVRVEEALKEGLKGEEIKKRIQTWRADEFRV